MTGDERRKGRKGAVLVVLAAAAAAFVLPASPASAGSATVSNACSNSVTPNRMQIDVTTSGADGADTASPGQALTLGGPNQSAVVPGFLFVAGYNLGLLVEGTNDVPANVRSTIEATNTVEGSQNTNTVGGSPPNGSVTLTTVITDPDGVPGTGDETATDPSFSVSYDDLNWTAGAGGTIGYRQQSIATAPPTAANNTLLINALMAGFLNVQFRCAPGTVAPPDPGTITLIDPAPSFDLTGISGGPLIANAGADQAVAPGALVTLDGSGSTGDALYAWSQLSGPAVTLSDPTSPMPTFTAPTGPATLEFQLQVCDPEPLCDTDTVVITVIPSMISIDDVGVMEGDSGQTAANFTVSLSSTQDAPVTVDYATADGTATAPGDYASATGTVTFAPGDTAEPVTVLVNGDTEVEPNETFFVNLSNLTGNAAIADGQGEGLIVDEDPNDPPIANAGPDQSVLPGATVNLNGTTSFDPDFDVLTYSWTQPTGPPVTLSDPSSATPSFTAPDVAVPTTLEFQLEVCDPAPLCDTDTVVITVIPPGASSISIDDVAVTEGDSGQSAATFTVSLSPAQDASVMVDFATADGSATAPADYASATGTLTFGPGDTSEPVTVLVNGDTTAETDETFFVNLSNPSGNAAIADGQGAGLIITDQDAHAPTANAGPDQSVPPGALVQLDGTGSTDPDGDPLTYAWSQLSGAAVTLSDPTSATPTFTAPTGPTILEFQLVVCDPEALCDTDTVVIPVQAVGPTVSNACANSITPNLSQIEVTTSGHDGLTEVTPGGSLTLSGLTQSAAVPGEIFVAGYNLGLLQVGVNNIPSNVQTKIEATNTVQGTQTTNTVGGTPPDGSVTVATTITDPDGVPGTGDETATDASFGVTYNAMNWTAGASGTIEYRQESIAAAPPTGANNTLLINTLIRGFLNVQFRCAPGTVTGPDPGVISLIDPAPSFDTTTLFLQDNSPTANAGPDQTVPSGTLVTLDGTASSDPDGEALTFNWTAPVGITLSDPTSPTPTFTAPQVPVPTPFTFTLEVCDEANPTSLCDTDTVVINVGHADTDAAGEVIVSGPVNAGATSKVYVFRVSNLGVSPITVDPTTDIDAEVLVNGIANGSVTSLTGTKTISPGSRARFRLRWTQDGTLAVGDTVEFTACVNLANDIDPANNCDSATRIAG